MQKKRNVHNKAIIFLIVVLLVLAFILVLGGKKAATNIATPEPQPTPQPEPQPLPAPQPTPAAADETLDSFIVFYTALLGTDANNLSYSIYADYNLESKTNKVNWDDSYYAALGYLPVSNRAYLLDRVKSEGYSNTPMQVITRGNKLFLLNNEKIEVIDPSNGKKLYTVATSTEISSFAVISNNIFYRDSAGDLLKLSFDSTQPQKLLVSDDPDNVGALYDIQDSLVTIYYNTDKNEYEIREHNVDTGKIIKTTNIIPAGNLKFYDGETAFYIVAQDETNQNRYYIYRIELGDTAETLIGLDLDESEGGILGVDESNGKLFVTIESKTPGTADSVVVHDLSTKESKEINFDQKISYTGNPPEYFSLN